MRKAFRVLFFTLLLSACVSYQPVPEEYTGPTTPIYDSVKTESPTKVHLFQLKMVNGRKVSTSSSATHEANYGKGFSLNPVPAMRNIPTENSSLRIEGTTYYAAPILDLLGENLNVEGTVDIDIQERYSYYVKGVLSKEYSAVWIENNNGDIVSEKIEAFDQ